ncbi:hypothetical protein TKK_0011308 [Trichogramma kaykai]
MAWYIGFTIFINEFEIYRISLPEDPSMPDPQLILFEPDTTPQIRNINSAPGRFPCGRCGKVYRWQRNLTTHLRIECGKEPSIICPYCPRRTKHRNSMRLHIRRVHKVTV